MQIALHSDDGRRVLSIGGVSYFNAWQCLKERIAAEHRIHEVDAEDAIQISEDAEGIERVTIDGKPAGYVVCVIDGHTFGIPANRNDDPAQAAVREVMEDVR